MRLYQISYMAASLLAFSSPALAASTSDDDLSPLETLWAKLPEADRVAFIKRHSKRTASLEPSKPSPAKAKTGAMLKAASSTQATSMAPSASPVTPSTTITPSSFFGSCPGLEFTLRKSWTDIDLTGCPQAAKGATGAVLSYSGDQIKHDDTWTAIGTAALIYAPAVNGSSIFSTGIYTSLNKVVNSSQALASSNADTVGYGAFLQYGVVSSSLDTYVANYFRLRGGAVNDNIKSTTNANVIAEWIPVYDDGTVKLHSPIPIAGTPALFRIDPEIQAQYIDVAGKNAVSAFNNRTQALPVGPLVTFRLYPGTSEFWSHFVPTVSYWWAYEPYSGKPVTWLDASLTYNLDQDGHLGVSFSYQKGNNVETAGMLTNMYLISLSGKI